MNLAGKENVMYLRVQFYLMLLHLYILKLILNLALLSGLICYQSGFEITKVKVTNFPQGW